MNDCKKKIGEFKKKNQLSFIDHLVYLFSSLFWPIPYFNGINLGMTEEFFGIHTGGFVTLLGDVVYNFKTKKLFFENPIAMLPDKFTYIDMLTFLNNSNKNKIILYIILLAISSGTFFYYFYKNYKEYLNKHKLFVLKKLKSINLAIDNIENVEDDRLCTICCTKHKSIIFKPCNHCCLCTSCYNRLLKKQCPYCRAKIEGKITIYASK